MNYVLRPVTLEDQERIFNDLRDDTAKLRQLQMRGGHFNNQPALHWAVDSANNSYLFFAPKLDVMASIYRYFFFFEGRMYAAHLKAPGGPEVFVDDMPQSDEVAGRLKKAISAAFIVHRIYGLADERTFFPKI